MFSRNEDNHMTFSRNIDYIFQVDFQANDIGGSNKYTRKIKIHCSVD